MRQLFEDGSTLHLEYIDYVDGVSFSRCINPLVFPTHATAVTQTENLLFIEVGVM
jgi:hypothetical protein